jgi:hypothetical protein
MGLGEERLGDPRRGDGGAMGFDGVVGGGGTLDVDFPRGGGSDLR